VKSDFFVSKSIQQVKQKINKKQKTVKAPKLLLWKNRKSQNLPFEFLF
jgi:hypothetical protein